MAMMKIPIFVSAPTALSIDQQKTRDDLWTLLDNENLEQRALGKSDYPSDLPLREVYTIAKHCAGGVILGFSQYISRRGILKPGTADKKEEKAERKFPTPWNQLEAGILFSLRLPLMVFREDGISGGVFDHGVTDVFVHKLPLGGFSDRERSQAKFAIQNWVGKVRDNYRSW
jgi:hypothetical protein